MTTERMRVYCDLADFYMNFSPADRYEVVSEVLSGERCPHGYPDQGEGCAVCDVPQEWAGGMRGCSSREREAGRDARAKDMS